YLLRAAPLRRGNHSCQPGVHIAWRPYEIPCKFCRPVTFNWKRSTKRTVETKKAGVSMKNLFLITLLIVAAFYLTLAGYAQWPPANIPPIADPGALPTKKAMRSFRSDSELASYFRELARKQRRVERRKEVANSVLAPMASE